ncbi:MAG TPA: putative zinc-binding metallopeptidase [Gammaproteobacteria bacterium]
MALIQRRADARAARSSPAWTELDDEGLLRLRFRDLRLRIEDAPVWRDFERVLGELERRGIRFRPHVWLSESWFSPDGVPGFAVPFFLAHPRLQRLEERMIGEAEGGTRRWRLQLLRHEVGHALDSAYGLRRRADWRRVFGRASAPYGGGYVARPSSRRYVLHLPNWYAQSHPTEDFAETFAEWLAPRNRWRARYEGWPALEKLEYVDRLMAEIDGRPPPNRDRSQVAPLSGNGRSLGEYYRRKLNRYGHDDTRYDGWLRRAFAPRGNSSGVPADRYVREQEPRLRRALGGSSHLRTYVAEHAIDAVRHRARQLGLVLRKAPEDSFAGVLRLCERVLRDILRRDREYCLR